MKRYESILKEKAKALLAEKKVDVILGYRQGTKPMTHQIAEFRTVEDLDNMVWDGHCALNLANYLPRRQERVALPVVGCSSRNVVIHIQENQVKRDQLVLLGVPCQGMIDHRAVKALAGKSEILAVEDQGDTILVKTKAEEKSLSREELLQSNCARCRQKNPVLFDELLGDAVTNGEGKFDDVDTVEAMSEEQRWEHFQKTFESCIRCYACRNACPLCYCPTCFVDENKPQWVGKSTDATDTLTFHFLRAFHMAGRCTDCGSCERACPVDIPIRYLTRKLVKDANELYGHEAGMSLEERPLLDAYKMTDINDFIR